MKDEYDPDIEMQAIHKQVDGWYHAFLDSPQYEQLSENERDDALSIIRFFTECSFRQIGSPPEQWDEDVVAECCLEVMPAKMSAERSFFQAVAPVLSAFFDFLASGNFLRQARDLSKAVARMQKKIVAASKEEGNWGPAKALVMAAQQSGVNVSDQEALGRFISEYNLRLARPEAAKEAPQPPSQSKFQPATPVRHSEPKPGRNDPCPCGSGKKFKKCCGK